ncbi:MAG: DUF4118 domain-containing protein [Dehalococcoidia bacterium]
MIVGNGSDGRQDTADGSQLEPEIGATVLYLRRWSSERWFGLLSTAATATIFTAIFTSFQDERRLPDIALIYIAITLVSAGLWGYAVGAFSAILTNVLLNYFFIPPTHTLTIADRGNVGGLVLFLLVAALGAALVSRLRHAAQRLESAVTENSVLAELSHAVASASDDAAAAALCTSIARHLRAARVELVTSRGGEWLVLAGSARAGQRLGGGESAAIAQGWEDARSRRRSLPRTPSDPFFVDLPDEAAPTLLVIAGMQHFPPSVHLGRFLLAVAEHAAIAIRLGAKAPR